jgi:acyl-CoA dehydrogenase
MNALDAAVAQLAATGVAANSNMLDEAAWAVHEVAAAHAAAVDDHGRFPVEAMAALKQHGLLGAMVPVALGGKGAPMSAIASVCEILGQACSSTAMVYAMHQIQVACILEHGRSDDWHTRLLSMLTSEQLLLASATSEDAVGGNVRNSTCAINVDGDRFVLEKLAPTISYGAYADGILVTARRTPESPPSDQVLITILKSDYQLEKRNGWDSMGMRGTCSEGFKLTACGLVDQVLPTPFGEISDQTMLPVSHALWSSAWTGIAASAVNRAKAFCRSQARVKPGFVPPGGMRLSEAVGMLQMMQARVSLALKQYDGMRHDPDALGSLAASLSFASDMNLLKTSVSTMALQVVSEALMICGMAGYKNGTEFSLGRQLRDLYSAPLMINNDRISANTASLLLAQRSSSHNTNSMKL